MCCLLSFHCFSQLLIFYVSSYISTHTRLSLHCITSFPAPFCVVQLIEDLRRELEHLQLYKLEAEKPGRTRSSSSGLADFSSRTREVELEHEVKRLKQVQIKPTGLILLCYSVCCKCVYFDLKVERK